MTFLLRRILGLLHCQTAATIVEFALLAPVLMMAMFGIIETSRLLWTKQTLDEVAYATARCMSVSTSCTSASAQKNFAVARAGAYGVAIVSTSVTPTANTTCNALPSANRIVVSLSFDSVMDGFVPGFPINMTATGCYPKLL